MIVEGALLLAGVIGIASAILILYARWNFGTLEKLGIPVVKPHWLLGSSVDYEKQVNHEMDYEWFKTYGEVFGVYLGRRPEIFVCDPEIARNVMVKDFDKFVNHNFNFGFPSSNMLSEMMDFLHDEKWKAVRFSFSRAFTSSKLKKIVQLNNAVVTDMIARMKKDIKASKTGAFTKFEMHEELFCMITDLISRVTMNIQIANPRDPNNEFAKGVRDFSNAPNVNPPAWAKPYWYAFPFVKDLLVLFHKEKSSDFFGPMYQRVVTARKKSGERNNDDFVDLVGDLLDKVKTDREFKKLGITDRTVIANAVEFYIAAQDQLAHAFSWLMNYVCKDPEIEQRLYDEVDGYISRNKGQVTHETLGEMHYLQACLLEALRLHPPFTRTDRISTEDVEYKGLRIPKGTTLTFPVHAYNRNPKYFHDPETYDPERFMPENKKDMDTFAYMSFGQGPRMCIGNKFAMESLTSTIIQLLKEFKFKTRPEYQPKNLPGLMFHSVTFQSFFDVSLRTEE